MKRTALAAAAVVVALAALAPVSSFAGSVTDVGPVARSSTSMDLQICHCPKLNRVTAHARRHWVGAGIYGKPKDQRVTGALHGRDSSVTTKIRIVNTGTATTDLDLRASSIRTTFYGGADWPNRRSLDPGESVTFTYTAHRGTAKNGTSMPVDITVWSGDQLLDGVRFLLKARR